MKFVRLNIKYSNGEESTPYCFCKRCKSLVDPRVNFCSTCGHRLEEHEKRPQMIYASEEEAGNLDIRELIPFIRDRVKW